MFWCLDCEACGILAPQLEIKPESPACEGKILTTGLPGKSYFIFLSLIFYLPGGGRKTCRNGSVLALSGAPVVIVFLQK